MSASGSSLIAHSSELPLGELAALGAATCWVFTSLAFAGAGRRIGSSAVNMTRLLLATVILLGIHRAHTGSWWPAADRDTLLLLSLSGLIGLAVGDQCLFTALVDIGPRLATLLMTLAPPVAALLAWPLLHERLGWIDVAGMTITIAGVSWVVMERPAGRSRHAHQQHRVRGVILGALAGVCQATGLVLAKLGIGHTRLAAEAHMDAWSATLLRMVAGTAGMAVIMLLLRRARGRRAADRAIEISPESEHLPAPPARRRLRAAAGLVVIGTIFGPVLGVWLSLVAIDRADAGIAATIMATSPVLILPFAVLIERERVTWRAAIGAVIAIAGVGVLMMKL